MIFISLFNECPLKTTEGENCILLKKHVLDILSFFKNQHTLWTYRWVHIWSADMWWGSPELPALCYSPWWGCPEPWHTPLHADSDNHSHSLCWPCSLKNIYQVLLPDKYMYLLQKVLQIQFFKLSQILGNWGLPSNFWFEGTGCFPYLCYSVCFSYHDPRSCQSSPEMYRWGGVFQLPPPTSPLRNRTPSLWRCGHPLSAIVTMHLHAKWKLLFPILYNLNSLYSHHSFKS